MKPNRRSSQASPPPIKPPAVSFMPRSQRARVDTDSSDEDAVEGDVERGDDGNEDDDMPPISNLAPPPTSSQSVSTRLGLTVISDDEEDGDQDEDDLPIAPSSSRSKRAKVIDLSSDTDEDVSPAKKRKIAHRPATSSSPVSERAINQTPSRRLTQKGQPSSPLSKRHKGHRTEKQKNIELLKRRRAGEKITQLTSSESESGDDKKGLYDTDSDDRLHVLDEFSDDESEENNVHGEAESDNNDDDVEEDADQPLSRKKKSPGKKPPRSNDEGEGNDESDLDDFVVDDDDAPLGAPLNIGIPIEFTAQASRPMKEQFPCVVEWLVHNKINPAFDRKDGLYINAWRKLDDEVRGLANSKFISSAWKVEFYRSLKARPTLEAFEMGRTGLDLDNSCEACGRSGHPATWKILLQGRPYHKDTLDEVESDDDDDSEDSSASGHESVDVQGNLLPPTSKEWSVGSTCSSNAETAHSLMHWKYHLKIWVEQRLEADGHMKAAKLKEREKMKSRKRHKAANKIVDAWREEGTTSSLYNDFKSVLQAARDKSTSGRGGGRWK